MSSSKSSEFLEDLKRTNFDNVLEQVLREESLKSNNGQSTHEIGACAQLCHNLAAQSTDRNIKADRSLTKLEALLKNKTVKRTSTDFAHFPKVEKLETRSCAGKYESCRNNEIPEWQLRCFRRPTEAPTTSMRQSTIGNFLKPQRDSPIQEVKPIGHTQGNQPFCGFRTAREELMVQNVKKYGYTGSAESQNNTYSQNLSSSSTTKTLGLRRNVNPNPKQNENPPPPPPQIQDSRLAHIDPKMVDLIENEIMRKQETVSWDDIAGLDYAKGVIEEIVIASLLRPDLYKGLRRPPRGVLLFGPPGTGKTMIGRCIASQSKSTFFSISASTITSKYVGESEKMVRALFAVATVHQPAVIFIDEIDSMLCKRNESEQEFTRRLKNEFLVQLDGTTTSEDDRIVVVGATNRPHDLDEAARRRLVRRLYIPLPDLKARIQMLTNLLTKVKHDLTKFDVEDTAKLTDGYSCADLKALLHEAALKPLRGIPYSELLSCTEERVRPVNKADISASLRTVRPTVAKADLTPFLEWNKLYGTVCENNVDGNEDP